ncbi:sulfotransferase [Mycobacterium ulcerans str. Harvey]|uniref:Sulfotransferase n=1 Tax=Mycobacterium ulcerans str. Harvey TaxID=1299332 RepID=A0ABP3AP45_MYCUL|nr:sulfotransferase [Mycobacterium ulcerans str. Harvey]
MADSPSSYLVLASQRSGSTLLVESLRATGVAGEPQEFFQYLPTTSQPPQPREWFAGVEDASILRLLDPLDEGKPDLAPPEIWRDYVRTVGRTPNGVWGGKLMWNQTPLLLNRARQLPNRSGDGLSAAIRDVIGENPSWSMSTVPMWCRRQCRSGARYRPESGEATPTRHATLVPAMTPARSPMW